MVPKHAQGFSLIALLILIAIVGIFGNVFFFYLQPEEQEKEKSDAKRKADLAVIQGTLERFYKDNGKYPSYSKKAVKYLIVSGGMVVPWGTGFEPYIHALPKDEDKMRRYVYYSTNDRQAYILYASLERGEDDEEICKTYNTVCPGVSLYSIPENACGGLCNYGVSSPNISP